MLLEKDTTLDLKFKTEKEIGRMQAFMVKYLHSQCSCFREKETDVTHSNYLSLHLSYLFSRWE